MARRAPALAPVLEFDAERHLYTLDGKPLPSVTQVLGHFLPTFHHDELAAKFGRAVHRACELNDLDDLDESSLDPMVGAYLEQYRRFRRDMRFDVDTNAIERRLWHPLLRVAGTLDRCGVLRRTSSWRVLVDLKTGAPSIAAGPQTAAYESMLTYHDIPPVEKRYSLHLESDRYNLIPHQSDSDKTVFMSALTVYRWLNPKGPVTP
jgi:hypothetical protein